MPCFKHHMVSRKHSVGAVLPLDPYCTTLTARVVSTTAVESRNKLMLRLLSSTSVKRNNKQQKTQHVFSGIFDGATAHVAT